MKKIYIIMLISAFFISCSDEEESYTLTDLQGSWEVDSWDMDMQMAIDFDIAMSSEVESLDEDMCLEIGGTYANGACTLSESLLTTLSQSACDDMNGVLSGLVCTADDSQTLCCMEGESQTLTITSNGSISSSTTYEGNTTEEEDKGTLAVSGNTVTLTLNNPSPDEGEISSFTMTGTLAFSGNTVTISLLNNDLLDVMVSQMGLDSNQAAAYQAYTVSYVIVMTKS